MAKSSGRKTTKRYIDPQPGAYSQAVVSKGGTFVWFAGHTAGEAKIAKSANFEAQTREVFERIGATLKKAGATLADVVTMTVFITDARYGKQFTDLRREIFGNNFPASARIAVTALALPGMLIEIQGIAIIDD